MFRCLVTLAAAAALCLSAAPAAPGTASPPIPAEAFAALPTMSGAQISPDGKRVVTLSQVGDSKVIVAYDLDGGADRFTRIDIGDKLDVVAVRWAGNRRLLLTVFGSHKLFGIEVPMTRLILKDLDDGRLEALTEKVAGLWGGDLVHVDPDGGYVLLAAQRRIEDYPSVLRVDLATLEAKEVVSPYTGVWTWYADPSGVVRAGLGGDADRWWLLYREGGEGKFRRIAKGRRPEDRSIADVETLIPVAGSDKGYVIANKATGRYGVYRYDFVANEIGEPVFEHDEVDVDSVVHSLRTGAPDSILYADDRDRIFWLDPEMRAIQARLDKTLPSAVNRIVSRDAADNRMIVWSAGASDPGTYYLYDRGKREMSELSRPYAALENRTLSTVEPLRYQARDGLSIPAYLTKPSGRGDKGLPLIVMPHGGPFARDKWEYDAWAQFLADRGYVVLQPNFRGSTGFGKAYVEAASGQFGRKMQDDLDDGVRWLADSGLIDPKRVCIMGASYGGYAAMWGAARNPDIYRCAISFAGISDVRTMLRYNPSQWIARRYYRDWRNRIRGDKDFDLDDVSPLAHAAKVRVPLLIAHGGKDETVPPVQSRKMHEALLRAKIDHEFVIYPEEGHGFEKAGNSADFLRRVEAFLNRHNPTG